MAIEREQDAWPMEPDRSDRAAIIGMSAVASELEPRPPDRALKDDVNMQKHGRLLPLAVLLGLIFLAVMHEALSPPRQAVSVAQGAAPAATVPTKAASSPCPEILPTVERFAEMRRISNEMFNNLTDKEVCAFAHRVHDVDWHKVAVEAQQSLDKLNRLKQEEQDLRQQQALRAQERLRQEQAQRAQERIDNERVERSRRCLADAEEDSRRARDADAQALRQHNGVPRTLNEQQEKRQQQSYDRVRVC